MIIGIDVSTSITGVACLENSGELLEFFSIDTRKFKCSFQKAQEVRNNLKYIKDKYAQPKAIYIEKSLLSFRKGFSSAKTLSTLSSFNGVVSWICYDLFDIKPSHIEARSARKICEIAIPKGEKPKPLVLKHIVDSEKDFVVEYTKAGNPKPKYYDMADAIVIARAGYKRNLLVKGE